MDPSAVKTQLVRDWLRKAHHDLMAAEYLSRRQELLDTAVCHCQRAAEKALKGLLVWNDVVPAMTHDLRVLVHDCGAIEPTTLTLLSAAGTLAPYAVRFRYPDAVLDPTDIETQEAIGLARTIYEFIEQRLPPDARP